VRQRVFNISCALSLVMFVASIAIWVRSHFAHDAVEVVVRERAMQIFCPAGKIAILYAPLWPEPGRIAFYTSGPVARMDRIASGWSRSHRSAGFGYLEDRYCSIVFFPTVVPVLLALILPALWLWRRRRQGGRGFPVEMNESDTRASDAGGMEA
jgi:hypothetical protein